MSAVFDKAILGGGCFWCLEAVYQELDGVESIVSGYAGGHVPNPTYEQVCSKTTGHAEVVQLTYDPARLSYADVLAVFFATHDPTTPDRQGNDVGPQYRSVIFHQSADQERVARETIAQLTADAVFPDPIVTQIAPLDVFYPAEASHQNYYRLHSTQPYCSFVISPKVAKMRKQFAARLRKRGS